jgi:hypothetical protein
VLARLRRSRTPGAQSTCVENSRSTYARFAFIVLHEQHCARDSALDASGISSGDSGGEKLSHPQRRTDPRGTSQHQIEYLLRSTLFNWYHVRRQAIRNALSWRDILIMGARMWTLLTDPLGRALLSILTADFGPPGDSRRRMLPFELQGLRARAAAQCAPIEVRWAIRSACWALRSEFPTAYSVLPAIPAAPVAESRAATPTVP